VNNTCHTYLDLGATGVALAPTSTTFSTTLGDSVLTFLLFTLLFVFVLLFLDSFVDAGGDLTFETVFALGLVAGVFLTLAVVFVTGVGLTLVLADFGAVFAVLQ